MSTLTFILGGARSGKSRYAQELAERMANGGAVVYIATAQAYDDEMRDRISRHKSDRPEHWRTVEEPLQVAAVLQANSDAAVILIDCLTLYVTNHLLSAGDAASCHTETWDEGAVDAAVDDLIATAKRIDAPVILVSNEVGMGLVPETPLGRAFRDIAGSANQKVAAASDEVYFMVAGFPIAVKFRS